MGYALVGIDMVGHGSRFDATDAIANLSNRPAFTGTAALRDGFGDTTGLATTFDVFEGFTNVAAVRDSIRQSALDLSRVVQLLRRPDLDLSALGPDARLDRDRIAYLGESFGTVVGTLFAAIEPDISLYVLGVPGGGILDVLLPTSAEIGTLAMPLIGVIYNPPTPLDRWSPLIGLMQAVIDGADPLSYAPHVLRDRFALAGTPLPPRHVVALEVVGDQTLSNRGTEALAQALGLDVLAPYLELPAGLTAIPSPAAANRDGQTAILVQYAPATHGCNWTCERGTLRFLPGFPADGDEPFPRLPAPIEIPQPIYETFEQVTEILATHFAGEAPRVRMTKPPVADFDADGVPDASDPAPLRQHRLLLGRRARDQRTPEVLEVDELGERWQRARLRDPRAVGIRERDEQHLAVAAEDRIRREPREHRRALDLEADVRGVDRAREAGDRVAHAAAVIVVDVHRDQRALVDAFALLDRADRRRRAARVRRRAHVIDRQRLDVRVLRDRARELEQREAGVATDADRGDRDRPRARRVEGDRERPTVHGPQHLAARDRERLAAVRDDRDGGHELRRRAGRDQRCHRPQLLGVTIPHGHHGSVARGRHLPQPPRTWSTCARARPSIPCHSRTLRVTAWAVHESAA